jgi:hypothetical protein
MTESDVPVAPKPWYREPWPWILMSGPLAVVLAGAFTAYLATAHEDALVADNYYKEGLAINRTLERERAAAAGGYRARLVFAEDSRRVRVHLAGKEQTRGSLELRLVHPTRSDLDVRVPLAPLQAGWYEGSMRLAEASRWTLQLEDRMQGWRLTGSWRPREGPAALLQARN